MNRYIQQLIEIFAEAEANPVPENNSIGTYEEFVNHMRSIEEGRTISTEKMFGVSYDELPPAEMLDKIQIQDLLIAIINALAAKGTRVHIPGNGVPGKIVYEEIREMFKEGFNDIPGWVIDFCSAWCPDCKFYDYCEVWEEHWTKEELEKERKNRV